MNGSQRIAGAVGAALVALGLVLATLPAQFIERSLHVEPDGGSGALELAIVLVLLGAGAALLVRSTAVARLVRRVVRARHDPRRA